MSIFCCCDFILLANDSKTREQNRRKFAYKSPLSVDTFHETRLKKMPRFLLLELVLPPMLGPLEIIGRTAKRKIKIEEGVAIMTVNYGKRGDGASS
jgi:hypothetical protein